MKPARRPISGNIKKSLAEFYGTYRCIVSDSEHPEFHHLNEDPSDSVFANLVPIDGTLNCTIETDIDSVDTNNITTSAQSFENRSRYARAYGCRRLLAWIHRKRLEPDSEVASISACIKNLRSILHYPLLEHTLQTSLSPTITTLDSRRRIYPATWAGLCEEISALLREAGHYSRFNEWNAHKNALVKLAGPSQNTIFSSMQMLRHNAFAASEQGDWTRATDFTDQAIAIGKDTGLDHLVTKRKTHILFELRHNFALKSKERFTGTLQSAIKEGLILSGPAEVDAKLQLHLDPGTIDTWAECHMQSIRVAMYEASGHKKRAENLFSSFASQYKPPYNVRATMHGNMTQLARHLAMHNIPHIWHPPPTSLLTLIDRLSSAMPTTIQEQHLLCTQWQKRLLTF